VNKGAPSLPHPQNCTSTEPRSKCKTVSPSDAPTKPLKVTIEEVEDEDEVRMKQKPKLNGPGILEEVGNDQGTLPSPPVNHNRDQNQKKVPTGKTEHFLQRIRGTPCKAMEMLRRWTSKDRGDEVTVFLLQALLTAPEGQAIQTLLDLKQLRHYISKLGG